MEFSTEIKIVSYFMIVFWINITKVFKYYIIYIILLSLISMLENFLNSIDRFQKFYSTVKKCLHKKYLA